MQGSVIVTVEKLSVVTIEKGHNWSSSPEMSGTGMKPTYGTIEPMHQNAPRVRDAGKKETKWHQSISQP